MKYPDSFLKKICNYSPDKIECTSTFSTAPVSAIRENTLKVTRKNFLLFVTFCVCPECEIVNGRLSNAR